MRLSARAHLEVRWGQVVVDVPRLHPGGMAADVVTTVLNPHVPVLAPALTPRVLDQPRAFLAFAIVPTDEGNGMIMGPLGVFVENAPAVGLECGGGMHS